MRCYFHLVYGQEVIPDRTGIEVADLDAAQSLALRAVQSIREKADQVNEEWRGWQLDIVCPLGSVLLSIPLDTRLQ
ncbi:DUF6894 family protein [Microvirga roseola]|uniref:DUF6894 family protein n=1 Tax=Microvirga roseola TaxID=2883126 RepID=UPI001E5EE486|nr:hypothetical protein [Microvirga roseola]